jgi:hypothetical protein
MVELLQGKGHMVGMIVLDSQSVEGMARIFFCLLAATLHWPSTRPDFDSGC